MHFKKYINYIKSNSRKIAGASLLALILLGSGGMSSKAEVITIEPLFEYPVAPEEIMNLTDKSNWLMHHFWDTMDFKKKGPVDQNALNDAMKVFVFPMQWAEKAEVDKAVDLLLSKIAKNPTLQLQFTKAAEETLYGQ